MALDQDESICDENYCENCGLCISCNICRCAINYTRRYSLKDMLEIEKSIKPLEFKGDYDE